jgi:hypothetical protein
MITQFKASYHVKYCPDNYIDSSAPTLFLEPVSTDDWSIIFLHTGLKIILWSKIVYESISQLLIFPKILKLKNVRHIIFNQSLSQIMERAGLDHFFLPDFLTQFFNQSLLKTPFTKLHNNDDIKAIYLDLPPKPSSQIELYFQIVKAYKYIYFYIDHNLRNSYKELINELNVKPIFLLNSAIDLPKNVVLILNLDSLLNPITYEMGLESIMTVSNEDSLYSIPFTDINSICSIIDTNLVKEDSGNVEEMGTKLLENSEMYKDEEFYNMPYSKMNGITIIKNEMDYKIIHNSPVKSNPGIYVSKYLMKGNLYLIRVKGYYPKGQDGKVVLWIATESYYQKNKKETVLLDPVYSLTYREDNVLNYIFHNEVIEEMYYIGLLFQDANPKAYFNLESIEIKQVN